MRNTRLGQDPFASWTQDRDGDCTGILEILRCRHGRTNRCPTLLESCRSRNPRTGMHLARFPCCQPFRVSASFFVCVFLRLQQQPAKNDRNQEQARHLFAAALTGLSSAFGDGDRDETRDDGYDPVSRLDSCKLGDGRDHPDLLRYGSSKSESFTLRFIASKSDDGSSGTETKISSSFRRFAASQSTTTRDAEPVSSSFLCAAAARGQHALFAIAPKKQGR